MEKSKKLFLNLNPVNNFQKNFELNLRFKILIDKPFTINDTIYKVYKKMKDIVKINEYFHGIELGKTEFLEKEKLMPNYYEICIIGDKDSGKDCLKNKFLYDCCEKNVNLYDFCIPRTINIKKLFPIF